MTSKIIGYAIKESVDEVILVSGSLTCHMHGPPARRFFDHLVRSIIVKSHTTTRHMGAGHAGLQTGPVRTLSSVRLVR